MEYENNDFDWVEILKVGATCGLKPCEIYELELWEFNAYVTAVQEQHIRNQSQAILTGYYTAYYMNGGKKAKNPNELIKKLYKKPKPKQRLEDGFRDIRKLREMEKSNYF